MGRTHLTLSPILGVLLPYLPTAFADVDSIGTGTTERALIRAVPSVHDTAIDRGRVIAIEHAPPANRLSGLIRFLWWFDVIERRATRPPWIEGVVAEPE